MYIGTIHKENLSKPKPYEMPLSNKAQIVQYLLQIVSEETYTNHFEFASHQPIQPPHPITPDPRPINNMPDVMEIDILNQFPHNRRPRRRNAMNLSGFLNS